MSYSDKNLDSLNTGELDQQNNRFALSKYLHYWYLFLLSLIICVTAAFLFIRYATPQYSVSALLMIKDKKDNNTPVKNERFSDFNDANASKNIDNEIIILKSASLMQKALEELSLNASYYVKGRVRNQEVYQSELPFKLIISKLDSTAFDKTVVIYLKSGNSFDLEENKQRATYQFGQLIHKKYGEFTVVAASDQLPSQTVKPIIIKFHDIRKLAADYSKKLAVTMVNKQSSVLSLSMTDAVPAKGKDILNKLIEVYDEEAMNDKNSIASNTIAFIDDRLKYLGAEVSNVEKKVEEFKQKNQVADVTSQINQSLEEASGYNKQVSEYGVQIDVLESIEKYISQTDNQQQLIPGTLNVQDPTLSGLIAKFNELQLDRERMLRTAQASNPVVVSMTEQVNNLRVNIVKNLESVKNGLLASRRTSQLKSGQFGARIQRVPTIERGLEAISRQQDLKRALYLYLLQKREEAALSLAATVSNSHVIDPATAGDDPISPQKPAVLLIGLMLGLGLPFAFVYIKDMMNDKVQLRRDVEWATSAPILGELVHSKSQEAVVMSKDNRSPLAEMFRLIRANFQFATTGKTNKVILITSSMSGEGKSFFSLNMCASLVLANKKVLLINMDLRKSNGIASGVTNKGVTDYLVSDTVSVDDIVQESSDVPGLYVITSGLLPPNPAELMMSNRVPQLLNILKESFDHIIIDSAPVGQVADVFALAPYIDATIYLVRYNITYKTQLDIVNRIMSDNKLSRVMLVLNDAKKNNSQGYGYNYGEVEVKNKKDLV
ncbi:GumC family protein [Hymenobacter nivis]|uniref:non-specific protein-tyrosine kinase n=1 Tax=Hymenobacter nivis TaxID=1850093 RepID=A0A502GWD2_9BACT|nr:tyrosine-protein kinase family protein [Hymenobacter nivis]TPG65540.1 polysaccharide biosynthesis tyrosine autokinase [Hymenobacter nivis]